jgi:hypothetical protein
LLFSHKLYANYFENRDDEIRTHPVCPVPRVTVSCDPTFVMSCYLQSIMHIASVFLANEVTTHSLARQNKRGPVERVGVFLGLGH